MTGRRAAASWLVRTVARVGSSLGPAAAPALFDLRCPAPTNPSSGLGVRGVVSADRSLLDHRARSPPPITTENARFDAFSTINHYPHRRWSNCRRRICGVERGRSVAADSVSTTPLGWPSDALVEQLREIADGVVSVAAGFTVAAIRIRRDEDLVLVVDTGGPDGVGSRIPVEVMREELGLAESWGVFHFISHQHAPPSSHGHGWVVPTGPVVEASNAWHPRDMLVAPIYDDDGELRGVLTLDEPADGLRPDADCRRVLEGFAAPASRAVLSAVERELFAEQVAMSETVKEIVRTTSAQLNLRGLLAPASEASSRASVPMRSGSRRSSTRTASAGPTPQTTSPRVSLRGSSSSPHSRRATAGTTKWW